MDKHDDKPPVFGEAIQAVMARRGCELTLGEAQEFACSLLHLIELRALVFYEDGNVIPWPEPGSHQAKIPE